MNVERMNMSQKCDYTFFVHTSIKEESVFYIVFYSQPAKNAETPYQLTIGQSGV